MYVPNFGTKISFGFLDFFIRSKKKVKAYARKIPSASIGKRKRVYR